MVGVGFFLFLWVDRLFVFDSFGAGEVVGAGAIVMMGERRTEGLSNL